MTTQGDHQAEVAPVAPASCDTGPIVWKRALVDGRPAAYGVIGHGLPVLFVHGWALGEHSYRAVVGRIAARGCRVYAPALPGSSGTADLPAGRMNLAGYGEWARRFLEAAGVTEPVVVVGHSFGGGVAIRLAFDHPTLVRSLVLVNSIGGSAWRRGKRLRSLAERPLWDWGLHFPSDVWPLRQATHVLPVVFEDAVGNLLHHPRSLWRVAQLARGADLRPELEELKRRHLPVTIIWAKRDGIVPREAFDALCVSAGAEGRVVDGSHSWLLADPDRFSEVITNDLEVAKLARSLGGTEDELPTLMGDPLPTLTGDSLPTPK
jgi:pimeloyl-ACP methyl ester carboxylesterase